MFPLMSFASAVASLPPALRDALAGAGALDPVVMAHLFDCEQEVGEFVAGLGLGENPEERVAFSGLVHSLAVASAAPAKRIKRAITEATGPEISVAIGLAKKQIGKELNKALLNKDLLVPASSGKWPGELRRKEVQGGVEQARAHAEKDERNRWVKAVVALVDEAGWPASKSEGGLRGAGQGRRMRTVKKRVQDWRKFRSFLMGYKGKVWPEGISDVLEYLQARAAEPCSRTVPTSFSVHGKEQRHQTRGAVFAGLGGEVVCGRVESRAGRGP